MPTTAPPLHESLLHGEAAPSERAPARRWAYPLTGVVLVSVFLLYHLSVLMVWNGPGQDLAKPFQSTFLQESHGYAYFRGTRNDQSWSMFAPNPDRTNNFVKVYVIDPRGEVWDFGQDIWAQDRYPYVFYDRRGKVNRNLDGKKNYQRIYGGWVCREWAQQHGEVPRAVRFVKRWTKVPDARAVIEQGGWDAWASEYEELEQETITCKKANRPVEIRTWVHGVDPAT